MAQTPTEPSLHGLMAEFETPEGLIEAIKRAKQAGYRAMDAYTPFPIHEVCELVSEKKSRVPLLVLIGGLTGASVGFGFQSWAMGTSYPFNIGGRPLFSWPAFIPVTFELTILFAAFCAVFGMFMLNGLPQPYHPVFNVERFVRASTDRYFLVLEAGDPVFDTTETRTFLEGLGSHEVSDVEA